ncbi:TetR/AcrR family transcriptional regulator [Pseudonocardia sp. HH130630-07]|uniref:TetR/AcrR family transcriptional regulator n=1 Tax=Pseudonocardia sp. HH130630-07 TaxID=1690815 RepID=UPI000814BCE1|nr:TetR/AcrR family transcriptional regulator [Pseudonocardia sp. HH130630-07]ANY05181.1 TetR family transcriptional regulator [Pseudonocardia sp. HH130630-07]
MPRWEPDSPGRLYEAALDLFSERGYDATTVEEIASRAGVTKRTFFRHYADKREVLFGGPGEAFVGLFTAELAAADPAESPASALLGTLDRVASRFAGRHEPSRRRQRVLAANASLRERELVKMATVAEALGAGLRERGVGEPGAAVAAETAVAVFRTAFVRWVGPPREERDLAAHVGEVAGALRAVLGER